MSSFGERLVGEFHDRVRGYVGQRLPERDAPDLVGRIFLRAVERQGECWGDPGAWLFAIARSEVAGYYRRREAEMRALEEKHERERRRRESPAAGQPLAALAAAEFRQRLREKLALLSPLERDVVAFKFTAGMTNAQIAAVLEITPNHLGVVLHRALQRLRAAMREEVGHGIS